MNLTILSFRSGMATSWQGINPESNTFTAPWLTGELVQHGNYLQQNLVASVLAFLINLNQPWSTLREYFLRQVLGRFLLL
jgi:hypothetical protein